MKRIEIHLTDEQVSALKSMSSLTGKSRSELIRQAVDEFNERIVGGSRKEILDRIAGIWRDRTDLRDFRQQRRDWDR